MSARLKTPPEGMGPPAPAAGDGQAGAAAQKKYTSFEAWAFQWVPTFTTSKKLAVAYGCGAEFDAQPKAMKRAINYFMHKGGAPYSTAVKLAKQFIALERKQIKARKLPVPKWLQE